MRLLWTAVTFSFSTLLYAGNPLPQKYDKWLNEDVVYIISSQERNEFIKLSTDAEREIFIQRFWKIRDTDSSTEDNEFRTEHYNRIKYANDRFNDGIPGWKTERGRVWIMHGPPDDILYQYGGDSLKIEIPNPTEVLTGDESSTDKQRQYTLTFNAPETEVWIYRHLKGAANVPANFEVIFSRTDPNHILLLNQALRFSTGVAQSHSERSRRDYAIMTFLRGHYFGGPYRIIYAGEYRFQDLDDFYQSIFHPLRLPRFDGTDFRAALEDLERSPGEVLMEKLAIGRALREKVRSRVFFEELPLSVRLGTLQARNGATMLPVSLGIPDKDQSGHFLGREGDKLDLMLELLNEQGETAATLADTVKLSRKEKEESASEKFLYQTRLAARPGKYKLSVYAALRGHSASAMREFDVILPDYSTGGLQMSDLLLFGTILTREDYKRSVGRGSLPEFLGHSNPLFLKDYVLIPSSNSRFRRNQKLTAFFEVYNPGTHASTTAGSLQVHCRFARHDGLQEDLPERMLSYLSDSDSHRTSYGISIPLLGFGTGEYSLQFDVYDPAQQQVVTKTTTFTVY